MNHKLSRYSIGLIEPKDILIFFVVPADLSVQCLDELVDENVLPILPNNTTLL